MIRRDELDQWLAKKAETRGLEIREGITVRKILPDKDGVTIETDQGQLRAQVVVGADGSNGITRRCIFPKAPINTARVLETITPVRQDVAKHPQSVAERDMPPHPGNRAYFDFFPVPDNIAGYVWDFRHKSKASLCDVGESTIPTSSRMQNAHNYESRSPKKCHGLGSI